MRSTTVSVILMLVRGNVYRLVAKQPPHVCVQSSSIVPRLPVAAANKQLRARLDAKGLGGVQSDFYGPARYAFSTTQSYLVAKGYLCWCTVTHRISNKWMCYDS